MTYVMKGMGWLYIGAKELLWCLHCSCIVTPPSTDTLKFDIILYYRTYVHVYTCMMSVVSTGWCRYGRWEFLKNLHCSPMYTCIFFRWGKVSPDSRLLGGPEGSVVSSGRPDDGLWGSNAIAVDTLQDGDSVDVFTASSNYSHCSEWSWPREEWVWGVDLHYIIITSLRHHSKKSGFGYDIIITSLRHNYSEYLACER